MAPYRRGESGRWVEGFDPHRREVLSRSFVDVAGLQCGYCIPGIAVKTAELLDKKPSPTTDEVRVALKRFIELHT